MPKSPAEKRWQSKKKQRVCRNGGGTSNSFIVKNLGVYSQQTLNRTENFGLAWTRAISLHFGQFIGMFNNLSGYTLKMH